LVLAILYSSYHTTAHDARFDGIFFIGVIMTGIYCRPICPARVAVSSHRRGLGALPGEVYSEAHGIKPRTSTISR